MSDDLFGGIFGTPKDTALVDIQRYIDEAETTTAEVAPIGPGDRVRASGIEYFCPRFEAMRHRDQISLREKTSGRLNRIFQFGRSFERYLRDEVFAPIGLLVGMWKCSRCDQHTGSTVAIRAVPRPNGCESCGGDRFSYVEPFGYLNRQESMLGGSADGFLAWQQETSGLEVKTVKSEIFKEISKTRTPLKAHASQSQIYMGIFDLRRSLIWYYNKNTSEQFALWMSRSDQEIRKLVAKPIALREYFETGVLPQRLCDTASCYRAKDCSLRELCFENG